jgi:hypothetical protein
MPNVMQCLLQRPSQQAIAEVPFYDNCLVMERAKPDYLNTGILAVKLNSHDIGLSFLASHPSVSTL